MKFFFNIEVILLSIFWIGLGSVLGVVGGLVWVLGVGGDVVDGGVGVDGFVVVGEEFFLLVFCEEGIELMVSLVGLDEGIGGIRWGDGGCIGVLEGGSLGIGNLVMVI